MNLALPRRLAGPFGLLASVILAAPAAALTQLPTGFHEEIIVDGLDEPTGFAFLPDGRALVVEQRTAKVRLVVAGQIAATDPVVVVPNVEAADQEEGLLGIAVDPGWPQRPYIYVHYNYGLTPNIRISRFTCTGSLDNPIAQNLVADPASRYDILTDIPDDDVNHNGGTVRFGTDGMLYVSIGDDYAECAAQDTSALLGRILRLDVSGLPSGAGGPPAKSLLVPPGNPFSGPTDDARLTWAFGLRNPFRFQVDRANGQLFIGDVGLSSYEEIDWADAPGRDFGWPYLEGPVAGPVASCPGITPGTYTLPIVAFDRSIELGPAAIVSVGVYRRPAVPTGATFPLSYVGDYFYADYYHSYIRRLHFDGSSWQPAAPVPGQPDATNWALGYDACTDFAQAADGSLWSLHQFNNRYDPVSGHLRRIVPDGAPTAVRGAGPPAGARFQLAPPQPNPASGTVTLAFDLARPERVDLAVRDLQGRRVRALLAGTELPGGHHAAIWDGRDEAGRAAPAGVYFVELAAGGERTARRVAVAR
jgi:glucose/arabinose dehydrogenase